MDDDDPSPMDPEDIELWEGVASNLRRRADKKIADALAIGHRLDAGYRPGEIRTALGLTVREYIRAVEWLGDAIDRTPRD